MAAAQTESPAMMQCLTRLSDNPSAVLAQARDWERHGGGVEAGQCGALALLEMGEAPEAAQRFDALAASLAAGRPPSPADPHAAQIARLAGQAARAWLLTGNTIPAEASAHYALSWTPDDLGLRILLAQSQYDRSDFAASLATLDRLPERGADDATHAYVLRASVHRRLGQIDAGLQDVARALALSPEDVDALLERGILRARHGEMAKAREDWDRVIALSPDTHDAYLARQDEDVLEADPNQPL
ncbi:tetratricopeptide repeat protein [Kozakia baliensis]|uniref:tetratricopeptide repeat protein n=1 Tax=Kozakia baliensis TaxID=153496 RepID=UPI00087C57C2|nr:tetratricopeptide repeat protein [Kozakia baliensis]AOX20627.1 hypothetical protein A0U90_10350 [Kozakia baliensis]